MKAKKYFLPVLLLATLCCGNVLADDPPRGSVRITGINYGYAGPEPMSACPDGSLAHMLSPDGKALTLLFDSFLVEVNADRLGTAQTKQCDINLTLQTPPGWEFGIFSVDMRGYGSFDPGTTGWQWAIYWLNGRGVSGVVNDCAGPYGNYVACKQFYGPFDDDYIHSSNLDLGNVPYSGCNRTQHTIKIRTGAVVKTTEAGFRAALLTVDSIDGEVTEEYNLRWRRCGGGGGPGRFIGSCTVNLKSRWRTIRGYTGQGSGGTADSARQNALTNATSICERVRAGNRRYRCDVSGARCSVRQQ